jgi:hypothetical protein
MKQKNRLSERATHFAREGFIGSAGSSIAVPTVLGVGAAYFIWTAIALWQIKKLDREYAAKLAALEA